MEKKLAVVSGDQVFDVAIRPGTTPHDVLTQLNLPREFMLSKRDGLPFGQTEDIYGRVQEGEKVMAGAQPVVGCR